MEYKLSKENYTVAKTLYDGTVQQSAELDYILPDYCPEIFKVLCVKILARNHQAHTQSGQA